MKKLLALLVSFSLGLGILSACGGTTTEEATSGGSEAAPAENTSEAASMATEDEGMSVAMVMSGPINDAGWNESAYRGLMNAQEDFGVETAYTENVPQPDYETVLRDYAASEYDLIIAHGFQFTDAVKAVSPEFPNSLFCVVNGDSMQEPNMVAVRMNTPQTGFLAGAAAGLATETDIIAMVGGTRLPHIEDALIGFEAGARYVNPDVEVLTGFTENFTDLARAKEMATAFIEQGADVVTHNADSAGLGVLDAAATEGVMAVGYVSDQYDMAPDSVVVSAIQSVDFMVYFVIEEALNGTLVPELRLLGANDGAIYYSDFHGHEDAFGEGGAEQLAEILAGVQDGSLREEGILPPSVFETPADESTEDAGDEPASEATSEVTSEATSEAA